MVSKVDRWKESVSSFLRRRFVADVVVLVVLCVAGGLIQFLVEPFERVYFPDDPSLRYPYKARETVSTTLLVILSVAVPLAAVMIVSYLKRRDFKDYPPAILGLWAACIVTLLVVDTFKDTVGRFRPDFDDRCQWNSTISTCTGDPKLITDGRKSFPSGHAASSFAGLGYLSMYLWAMLPAFSTKRGNLERFVLILLPLMGASLIGISRICDYRHHWSDVFAGSIIGLLIAFGCHCVYYPPFWRKSSSQAYYLSALESDVSRDSHARDNDIVGSSAADSGGGGGVYDEGIV